MIEDFFSSLTSRAASLRSDDELRSELAGLTEMEPKKAELTARLDEFLSRRSQARAERREAHRKGSLNAKDYRV